jgi:hypothetical protein
VPFLDPYKSSKGLAGELDALVAPGEKFVYFRKMRDSALFYTNRQALVIKDYRELNRYFESNENASCVIKEDHYKRLDKLRAMSKVVYQQGEDLIIVRDGGG